MDYSTVNYKDGLCLTGAGGLVRNYPHVPGIDFAGTVEASDDARYKPGDKVVLTGWRVGEAWWGGYAQKARVKADWLVPLPDGLSTKQAMAVGTAGFTAMLAVMALEDHGLAPDRGEVLVTGAAGGVGSVATAILANLGYQVAGVTGRPETADYLKDLGAQAIVAREELNEPSKRPLEAERWAGCVDAVGGVVLAACPGAVEVWRLRCGCWACRGREAGDHRDPLPVARRQSARHRFGHATLRESLDRLAPDRFRSPVGKARSDDPAGDALGPAHLGRRDPERPSQGTRRGRRE